MAASKQGVPAADQWIAERAQTVIDRITEKLGSSAGLEYILPFYIRDPSPELSLIRRHFESCCERVRVMHDAVGLKLILFR